MSNLGTLIKYNFITYINSIKYSKRRSKFLSSGILFAVIGAYLIFSMSVSAVAQTKMFLEYGKPEYALFYAVVYCLLLVLLMAVMRGVTPTHSSDADLLLSMPLTRREILVSKSVSRYLFELIPVTAFFLPSIVVYYVIADRSVGLLLRGLLIYLLLPLLSVGVSYILSFVMFKISNKFERPQLVSSALSIVILLAFMYFNFSIAGASEDVGALIESFEKIRPAAWGAFFIARGGLMDLLRFCCITALPFAAGVLLFAAIYGARQSTWRSKDKTLRFVCRSPIAAVFHKEATRYFSSTTWMLNTIIGPVFTVGMTVFLLVGRSSEFYKQIFGAPEAAPYVAIILTALYSFFPAMTAITASSISLEGRNLWVLRASPMAERDIFLAKILFNIALSTPFTLAGTVVCALTMPLTGTERLLLVALPTLVSVLTAVSGLYINLVFPKMQWDNEVAVVKQSTACMLSVFGGMALAMLPVGVNFALSGVGFGAKIGALAAFYALLTALFAVLIATDGKKRFLELS